MPKDDRVLLRHMLEAAADARAFVAGCTRANLDTDRMRVHAVARVLAVLGEAASRV